MPPHMRASGLFGVHHPRTAGPCNTGKTTVNVIRHIYETRRTVADAFKATMRLCFDDLLPKWNYEDVPQ